PHILVESDLETIPMEWEQVDLPDDFGFAKVIDNHIFAATGGEIVRIEADLQTTETITVPTPVRHFDVAGDTIVVASQPNWDAGCDEPETPAVVISYDGGATWAEVDLPWNLQVGRLTSRGYLTVAANEHATLIARDSMPSFLASSGCLGDLAGLGSDVYVNRVTDTGVVFDLNSGGSEVVTWSEMELTDEEISYMREVAIDASIPEPTPIYRVDGTTALETSSVGGLIWSTDGRFVVFDWASGPPSSVRVSDDATDWETINVGQNSWFSNSLHRSTGEGVEYSLDAGRTWSAVPRPPRSSEVAGYVEIDGFTVANRNDVARDSLPAFHHESGQWVELESPDPELRGQVLGVVDHRLAVVAWTSLGPRLFVGRPAEIGEPVSPGG
ncbi:MAG: hypothetical protein GY708_25100, partial [Actinomycetia bacterium]|nr:hypothetical protein [Actinomycetes bacterium]